MSDYAPNLIAARLEQHGDQATLFYGGRFTVHRSHLGDPAAMRSHSRNECEQLLRLLRAIVDDYLAD